MADGSKVEDLNVLRERDHLFFVWRKKIISAQFTIYITHYSVKAYIDDLWSSTIKKQEMSASVNI